MLALLTLWGSLLQVGAIGVEGMIVMPAGAYTPLLQGNAGPISVAAFYLDQYAVTNAQYLAFVTAVPRWRRSQVTRLFADQAYLRHWQDDLSPAEAQAALWQSPVTHVSWFAARAYCRWQQKRLPSTAEWEYAAMASAEAPDGRTDPTYLRRLLEWYAMPNPAVPPPPGSGGKKLLGGL
jgi:formylglycine-generating enzyme required for sulfatase activity